MLYVPCGSEAEAESLAKRLLAERLIACGNIYASRSLYHWEGQVADEVEHVLVCKTLASRSEQASSLIEELHSYDVPCILRVVPTESNEAYYSWVAGEVSPETPAQVKSGAGGT